MQKASRSGRPSSTVTSAPANFAKIATPTPMGPVPTTSTRCPGAMPARATAEQFTLFQRYQKNRHADGDMAAMGYYDYRAMIEDTPISTGILEFRDTQDRLLGACLTDWLADGLSAVYSFFDTDEDKRSLGTFAVLWLIGRARSLGLPYVYLGYWVPESRKMAYKARFRPSEILISGAWHRLGDDAEVNAAPREVVRVG